MNRFDPCCSRIVFVLQQNADREIFIFSVELTTCRIGNLTRLIHTLAICVTIHTYMNQLVKRSSKDLFLLCSPIKRIKMRGDYLRNYRSRL